MVARPTRTSGPPPGQAHLLVKVSLGELQRVEQSVGGGQLDVVAGLLLPHALDDGRQDLVGAFLQLLWVLDGVRGHRLAG